MDTMVAVKKFTITDQDAREVLVKHRGLLKYWASYNMQKWGSLWSYEDIYMIGVGGLIKALDRHDSTKSKLSTYAILTMNSELRTASETELYQRKFHGNLYDEATQGSLEAPDTYQAKMDLAVVLKSITSKQRDVLVLRQIYGYTLKETADLLYMTHQAVDDLERRAMIRLRSIYAKKIIH